MTGPATSRSDARSRTAIPRDAEVRLVARGGRWQVMIRQAAGWTCRGELTAAAVDGLRRKGRLRQRPDGSWDVVAPPPPGSADVERPGFSDAESPLTWLRTRKDRDGRPLISEQQYLAGERLRADFERAMLAQRVTASWEVTAAARRGGGQAAPDLSDSALAARQRFHKAMDAVGPELASILWHVCCLASGLEQAERHLELPQRSGKAVLGLALTALARHYGLTGGSAQRHSTSWGLPGYRPSIPEREDA